MEEKCYICNMEFATRQSLERHLNGRCKSPMLKDLNNLNNFIKELVLNNNNKIINNSGTVNNQTVVGNNNNNTIKIEININPITKLDLDHIPSSEMKSIIEKFDNDTEKLNLLLGDYIKNMICDSSHPENQPVKYIKKRPPTYNSITEDSDGNTINVIRGLKDTCELLSDPILDSLKQKLNECLREYRLDGEFDFSLYETAFKELKKELNKKRVKKALNGVLKNDILENIEMKLHVSESF